MKNKTAFTVVIVILLFIAFVLGIAIYQGGQVTSRETPSRQTQPEESLPSSEVPTPPGPNASEEEKAAFAETIRRLAREANTVEIGTQCSFTPSVVRVREGDGLTFKNLDDTSHLVIMIDQYTIPAGGAHALTAKFEKGPGVYGIACDDLGIKGYMEVVVDQAQ